MIADLYLKPFSTVTVWKLKEAYGVAYAEWRGEEWITVAGVACVLNIPFTEGKDALTFLKCLMRCTAFSLKSSYNQFEKMELFAAFWNLPLLQVSLPSSTFKFEYMEIQIQNSLYTCYLLSISFRYYFGKMEKDRVSSLVMGTSNLCSVLQSTFLPKATKSAVGWMCPCQCPDSTVELKCQVPPGSACTCGTYW